MHYSDKMEDTRFKLGRILGFAAAMLIPFTVLYLILDIREKNSVDMPLIIILFSLIVATSLIFLAFRKIIFFQGLKKGFLDFGVYITKGVNFVLLTFVYIFGVGLTSLIARIAGKSFLDIKKENKNDAQKNDEKTYWENYNLKKEKKDRYYNQF